MGTKNSTVVNTNMNFLQAEQSGHKIHCSYEEFEHQCFVWAEFVSVVDSIPHKTILLSST
jgi:hypothetical protein